MKSKSVKSRGFYGFALLAGVALMLPLSGRAQETPGTDPTSSSEISNQPIRLDLENADLYSAMKLLFAQIKANYTLDPTLRQSPVTAHLSNVPFQIALDTLLRSVNSPVPLTYRVESGIYSIVEKRESTDANPEPNAPADTATRINRT